MVLKSVHMELRTTEVPVRFLKDREGRESHHKRMGWFSPWQAAWINLRAMFVYGADFFALRPGAVLLSLGLLLTLPLAGGPVEIGSVTLSLYTMLLGLALTVIGLQGVFLGCIAQVLFDYTGKATRRWMRIFPYSRTVGIALALGLVGFVSMLPLLIEFLDRGLELGDPGAVENHLAVFGATMLVSGFSVFVFTLILHGAVVATDRDRAARDERDRIAGPRTAREAAPSLVDRFGSLAQRPRRAPPRGARRRSRRRFRLRLLGELRSARSSTRSKALSLVDIALAPDLAEHRKVDGDRGPASTRSCRSSRRTPSTSCSASRCSSTSGAPTRRSASSPASSRPGGTLLINVPSWRGKTFLEFAAFRARGEPEGGDGRPQALLRPRATSGRCWSPPGSCRAGIRCHRHKFGLNTFAACRASAGGPG